MQRTIILLFFGCYFLPSRVCLLGVRSFSTVVGGCVTVLYTTAWSAFVTTSIQLLYLLLLVIGIFSVLLFPNPIKKNKYYSNTKQPRLRLSSSLTAPVFPSRNITSLFVAITPIRIRRASTDKAHRKRR